MGLERDLMNLFFARGFLDSESEVKVGRAESSLHCGRRGQGEDKRESWDLFVAVQRPCDR